MSKFKVGDKVRVIDGEYDCDRTPTTIIRIDNAGDAWFDGTLNGSAYRESCIDDLHLELVKETEDNMLKIGVKYKRVENCENCGVYDMTAKVNRGPGNAYIIFKTDHSYDIYNATTGVQDSSCSSCFSIDDTEKLELFEENNEGDTTMARRTFMLKSESPSLLKGALVQERCDDGTQPYDLLNPETHSKDPSFDVSFAKRELVEDAPKFWVEVFAVDPQYMTAPELEAFEAFKKSLKTKRAKKVTTKVAKKVTKKAAK